jgi:queuine/archaeosine tRNA-ribosyltransferase
MQVLLEAHNTRHYLRFFEAVRTSVAAGGFAAYRAWFLARRQRWLVAQQQQV